MRMKQEQKELFWQYLEPEYKRAMMFCRKLAGERDRGDDLFQDTLVNALRKFDQLRDRESFRPWLYRSIVNTYTSSCRAPWFKRRRPMTVEVEQKLIGADPSREHATKRWLHRAMAVLTPEQHALVTLHELQEWSIAEIADLYRMSEGSIKARLFRARRRMKKAVRAILEQSGRNANGLVLEELIGLEEACAVAKPGLK